MILFRSLSSSPFAIEANDQHADNEKTFIIQHMVKLFEHRLRWGGRKKMAI